MAVRHSFLRLGEEPPHLDEVAAGAFVAGADFIGRRGKKVLVGRRDFPPGARSVVAPLAGLGSGVSASRSRPVMSPLAMASASSSISFSTSFLQGFRLRSTIYATAVSRRLDALARVPLGRPPTCLAQALRPLGTLHGAHPARVADGLTAVKPSSTTPGISKNSKIPRP